ncbi:Gfo/Idh/MocA family protein [Paenibacillus thalictri]|uniref:Gfo/Idh/MocA family oxidoreductase n=1 Tax=Paenibacillus thalictri TaxID=2527873 RepID=A0A4Q9DKD7_9BACL|nr:Gfo/Idh/MocA family oxidoreductase [Paenibacillus thalictri]TBL71598.1 Gfo/Idh/MocA family oxidoreductase [Paenibacillus thalictri]
MESAFKIGLVGCGNHMYEFIAHCLKWAPPVTIQAVCDLDEAKLERFANYYNVAGKYTDYREMFAKEPLDAVICVINETAHYDVAKAAMLSGLHIFVEKTPCLTSVEAEELAQIQKSTGKTTMVGFNRRFMTSYVMAKEISQRPEFGGIYMYQSQFNTSPYRSEAFFKINHVIHHLDLARFMMGEITLTQVQRVAIDDRRVGYTISFRSEQGGIGTIQSGSLLDELYPIERLELLGDRRNVVVDNVRSLVYNRPPGQRKEQYKTYALVEGGDALVWNPSLGVYPRYSYHGYEDELHYFIQCVMDGRKPEPNIEDSVQTMRLVEEMERLLAVQQQTL